MDKGKEIVTPESKAEKELPANCRKCRFFKHANKFYCYNPPEGNRGPTLDKPPPRVVTNPSDGRMSWCQLEKEVEDET